MTGSTIAPFCVSRPSDRDDLARMFQIFETAPARRIGLKAILQRYRIVHGQVQANGVPVLLVPHPTHGRPVSVLGHGVAMMEDDDEIDPDILTLRDAAERADLPPKIATEMLYVTSEKLWCLSMPGILVMQATDIVIEINAAKSLNSDIGNSTMARAAYATVRVPPPISAHERMRLLTAVPEALRLLQQVCPDANRAARDAGYTLGPFRAEILERAIEAA